MEKVRVITLALLMLFILIGMGNAYAQNSNHYVLSPYTLNSGGGFATVNNLQFNGSLGQTVIEQGVSVNYRLSSGYWKKNDITTNWA
jgi:hypothetical protein